MCNYCDPLRVQLVDGCRIGDPSTLAAFRADGGMPREQAGAFVLADETFTNVPWELFASE
jgi:hypothetical protein